jgi:hypothetical protein
MEPHETGALNLPDWQSTVTTPSQDSTDMDKLLEVMDAQQYFRQQRAHVHDNYNQLQPPLFTA